MENSKIFNEFIAKQHLLQIVIWGALTFSILFYVIIAHFISATDAQMADGINPEMLNNAFLIAAAVCGLLALSLFPIVFSDEKLKSALEQTITSGSQLPIYGLLAGRPVPGKSIEDLKKEVVKEIDKLENFEKQMLSLSGRYFITLVVSLALSEVVAISGLLLALTNNNGELIYPYAGAAILINLFLFPNFKKVLNRARSFDRGGGMSSNWKRGN